MVLTSIGYGMVMQWPKRRREDAILKGIAQHQSIPKRLTETTGDTPVFASSEAMHFRF
jgi:hypothetical protein